MVRKAGKLPPPVIERNYALEYGEDRIAVSSEIIKPGMKVHIHDDLLATGGTMNAAIKLIESCGATVVSVSFVIELTELHDVRMNNGFAILENGDKGIRSYSYLVL
jgi:adenine phosphoribosyltransferase